MATKKNLYPNGNYNLICNELRRLKIATLNEIATFIMDTLQATDKRKIKVGKNKGEPVNAETFGTLQPIGESAALASAQVIMSPRLVDETDETASQGRGNMSAQGHLYYCEPMKRKVTTLEDGTEVKEDQRYRFRLRKEVLPPWNLKTRHMTLEEAAEWEAERQAAKLERAEKQAEADADKKDRLKARLAKRKVKEAAQVKADKVKAKRKALREAAELKAEEAEAARSVEQETEEPETETVDETVAEGTEELAEV